MDVIITSAIFIVLGISGYLLLRHQHIRDMEELAADCSKKLQEKHRELVVLCTEEGSIEAHEIKLRIRLNAVAEDMLFSGTPALYKKEGETTEFIGVFNNIIKQNN